MVLMTDPAVQWHGDHRAPEGRCDGPVWASVPPGLPGSGVGGFINTALVL